MVFLNHGIKVTDFHLTMLLSKSELWINVVQILNKLGYGRFVPPHMHKMSSIGGGGPVGPHSGTPSLDIELINKKEKVLLQDNFQQGNAEILLSIV